MARAPQAENLLELMAKNSFFGVCSLLVGMCHQKMLNNVITCTDRRHNANRQIGMQVGTDMSTHRKSLPNQNAKTTDGVSLQFHEMLMRYPYYHSSTMDSTIRPSSDTIFMHLHVLSISILCNTRVGIWYIVFLPICVVSNGILFQYMPVPKWKIA